MKRKINFGKKIIEKNIDKLCNLLYNLNMNRFATTIEKIKDVFPNLRKGHQSIAKALLENPENAFLSATTLADELGVSPASFVRFAKKLGFSGYLEMKRSIISDLRRRKSEVHTTAITPFAKMVEMFLGEEIDNLSQLSEDIDERKLELMSKRISRAKRIIVTGYGFPSGFAVILADYLRITGLEAESIVNSRFELFDSMTNLGKKDGLIIIDHGKYVKDFVHVIEVAKKWNVFTAVISDSIVSPLARLAHLSLFFKIKHKEHVFAHSQLLVLIELLSLAVWLKRKKETEEYLKKHPYAWEEHDFLLGYK
jgi:DNA-binding MurR/RpiR family transcriptional regulator